MLSRLCSVDAEGCSWYFVRKASSRFTRGARFDVFIKMKQTTVILLTYISSVCVFMRKEKVWKNTHLTFSIDVVCALEEFGKMGRRDNYIFLCTPQFSLTWPK